MKATLQRNFYLSNWGMVDLLTFMRFAEMQHTSAYWADLSMPNLLYNHREEGSGDLKYPTAHHKVRQGESVFPMHAITVKSLMFLA